MQFDRARNWKIRSCLEPCSPTAISAAFIARPRMSYLIGCRAIAICRTRRWSMLCCWPSCRTGPAHHRHRSAAAPGRFSEPDPVPEDIDPPGNDILRDPMLDRTVLDRAQRGNWTSALRLIASARSIPLAYAAQLRAEVAQILFIQNEDINAELVADLAVNGAPAADQPGLGFYIGGLAAWRLHRFELARAKFEGGATASKTSPRLHAASAFWASRASRRLNDLAGTLKWLEVAAGERLTLHGLLARRILRMDPGSLLSGGLLSQADVDAVAATPHGLRAFALLQIGQPGAGRSGNACPLVEGMARPGVWTVADDGSRIRRSH